MGADTERVRDAEAPYETDDIVFADESGNEIDDILGKGM